MTDIIGPFEQIVFAVDSIFRPNAEELVGCFHDGDFDKEDNVLLRFDAEGMAIEVGTFEYSPPSSCPHSTEARHGSTCYSLIFRKGQTRRNLNL